MKYSEPAWYMESNRLALSMSAGGEIEDSEREGLLRGLVAALARDYANLEQGHRLRRPWDKTYQRASFT